MSYTHTHTHTHTLTYSLTDSRIRMYIHFPLWNLEQVSKNEFAHFYSMHLSHKEEDKPAFDSFKEDFKAALKIQGLARRCLDRRRANQLRSERDMHHAAAPKGQQQKSDDIHRCVLYFQPGRTCQLTLSERLAADMLY